MGVALVLDRLGFDEDVVVAGLMHDVVEDTEATLDEVRPVRRRVARTVVAHCSEVKTRRQRAGSGPGSTASATTSKPGRAPSRPGR